nr:serine/threonine-protein kinase CST20-like isoform X2 [Leptinotarsa decemlineata]
MGNKLCKKKVDAVDNAAVKSPTTFDRIINRLHIRPSTWKSDSQLDQKQVNRYDISSVEPTSKQETVIKTKPLSRSSDWTDADLEVPDKEEHIHLRNPKLSIIFNNENGTPTPPPRKHKKNFREKIEAVAKSGLQAFQQKKPVEETICVKKTINYKCPLCDQDESGHNRDHHHNHNHNNHDNAKTNKNGNQKERRNSKTEKESLKRMNKNLSVMSLPNYDELKLTVTHFEDIDKGPSSLKINSNKRNTSETCLPTDSKKPTSGSTGKLDAYITRCRSFGSIFPQQLKKLRSRKAPAEIESDDSFGGLEDWDLGLLEHYNPKDASLPRPRKTQRNSKEIISDIESLIVAEEDIEKPKPPVRRSESLVKKINRENAQTALKRSTELLCNKSEPCHSPTPPPSPNPGPKIVAANLPTEADGQVEHSSLMRILEQFSMKDKQNNDEAPKAEEVALKSTISSNQSSLTPSLLEFEKNITVNSMEDFINAEKLNTDRDLVNNNFKVIVT